MYYNALYGLHDKSSLSSPSRALNKCLHYPCYGPLILLLIVVCLDEIIGKLATLVSQCHHVVYHTTAPMGLQNTSGPRCRHQHHAASCRMPRLIFWECIR